VLRVSIKRDKLLLSFDSKMTTEQSCTNSEFKISEALKASLNRVLTGYIETFLKILDADKLICNTKISYEVIKSAKGVIKNNALTEYYKFFVCSLLVEKVDNCMLKIDDDDGKATLYMFDDGTGHGLETIIRNYNIQNSVTDDTQNLTELQTANC